MALAAMVRERVTFMVDQRLSSADAHAAVAEFARTSVKALIRNGTFPPAYVRYVDNVENAPEEAVKLDHGLIEYEFSRLTDAVAYVLAYLVTISPVKTGEFAKSWFVMVNGTPWAGSIKDIPAHSVVTITNFQPFTRRLEQGWKRVRSGLMMTEAARRKARTQFPSLDIQRTFVSIPGGYVRVHDGAMITYPAVVITDA